VLSSREIRHRFVHEFAGYECIRHGLRGDGRSFSTTLHRKVLNGYGIADIERTISVIVANSVS
jgi:hypothetical protein